LVSFYFTTVLLTFAALISYSQEEQQAETPIDSPLIALVNRKNGEILDFNSIGYRSYKNTIDSDLDRITEFDLLKQCVIQTTSIVGSIGPKYLNIGDNNYHFYGENSIENLGTVKILIGEVEIVDVSYYLLVENYYMITEDGDSVIRYENYYYSFFKGEDFILDVFSKSRFFEGNLVQSFEGISFDENINNPKDVQISLFPNPASSNTDIKYELFDEGSVTIKIMNAEGTVDETVYLSLLDIKGRYKKSISLDTYPPGIYTVSIFFQNQNHSTTLIKL